MIDRVAWEGAIGGHLCWMIAHYDQHSTHVNNAGTIGLKERDRGSASRCYTKHLRKIFTPIEMLRPQHLTRLKKWHFLLCDRIRCFGFYIFAVVAGLTG